ncbi:MAG: cobalamin B12-binding domain-containing protein [Ketobacteraceae bacterium]|nr:cobalamin B12-binding domain-containing protein [Ketobacteraceae bacterium]
MHSIQAAAEKSGLTADVIRVWERRYKAISPERTPANQRVYSNDDVYRLVLLRKATEGGRRISSVANLPTEELEQIASELEIARELAPERGKQENLSHNYLEICINDILMLDPRPFERHLQQALVEMGLVSFLMDLVHPLLFKVGSLWQKGNIRTCQEHFASAAMRSFLGRYLVDSNTDEQGPRIIVATPPNHSHELGSTIAGVLAATRGWQVVYLGPSVPVEELIFAADCKDARAVALSLSFPVLDPAVPDYLIQLRNSLPSSVHILVGGASYTSYSQTLEAIQAECSDSLDDFISTLDRVRGQ